MYTCREKFNKMHFGVKVARYSFLKLLSSHFKQAY